MDGLVWSRVLYKEAVLGGSGVLGMRPVAAGRTGIGRSRSWLRLDYGTTMRDGGSRILLPPRLAAAPGLDQGHAACAEFDYTL